MPADEAATERHDGPSGAAIVAVVGPAVAFFADIVAAELYSHVRRMS